MEFQRYFQSFNDYFWEWDNLIFSEDSVFETITIPNGQTIVYEKFVFEILEFLSDDAIPPFGTLLLTIVATNPEAEKAIEMIGDLIRSKNIVTAFPQSQSFRTGASIDFLKMLSNLPEDYKTGEKRLKLFQTIFHQCHNKISSTNAKTILEEYKNNRHHLVESSKKEEFNEANFRKDFRTLALLKVKFPTIKSILDAMEGIPHQDLDEKLHDEILEEQNLSENVNDFVDQLIQDDRTFQVGSLVKRLWSGLNIPLHHNHPSQQPLGGISDLTNKGDFDKLVISEFAYDDDVFMSRIANNEALYIQREVPPEADKFQRILLLDLSLKNWGNPKILSFASAIAIARHPKTDIECKVFVIGNTFKEISLDNINQVIYSLGELNGKLECSAGLHSFFQENKINSKNQEVFLFSSEESLKMHPMQKVLSDYFSEIKYVFEIELEGIKVFKNQNKGRKMLQHIIMPLDELWVRDNSRTFAVKEKSVKDIPLLYPVERFYQNIFSHNNENYIYMNNSLFKFSNDLFTKGFIKIASNLSFKNGNFAMKTNSKGEKILLYNYYNFRQYLSTINLNTYELKSSGDFANKITVVSTYESKSSGDFVSDINGGGLKVFEYNNEFYFTDNISFWLIDDDFKIHELDANVIKDFYDEHFERKTSFVNLYKNSKIKYNLIKKLDSAVIDENDLRINDYNISTLLFQKTGFYFRRTKEAIVFEESVNLILKTKGTTVVNVVKAIKVNTNKSLTEAKEIVETPFSVILSNVTKAEAEKLKKEIEKNGAVCYIEVQYLKSPDGSKITNQNGILVFESSNKKIEKFYVPFVINVPTAMASHTEFTGNPYFFSPKHDQTEIGTDRFREKYYSAFIQNIVGYGA